MINNKGKSINSFLCSVNQAPRNEDLWWSGGIVEPFFTWSLNGVEWSVSRPCRFTLRDRRLGGPQRRSGR
jgi:hypothetical protein